MDAAQDTLVSDQPPPGLDGIMLLLLKVEPPLPLSESLVVVVLVTVR